MATLTVADQPVDVARLMAARGAAGAEGAKVTLWAFRRTLHDLRRRTEAAFADRDAAQLYDIADDGKRDARAAGATALGIAFVHLQDAILGEDWMKMRQSVKRLRREFTRLDTFFRREFPILGPGDR